MANNPKRSAANANAACDAAVARVNGGFCDVYDGAQPAGPGTAITTQVKLFRFNLSNPAFGAAVSGTATANAIASGLGLANGTASWCRVRQSDETAEWDGSVDTSGADLNLNSVTVTVGVQGTISSLTYTEGL